MPSAPSISCEYRPSRQLARRLWSVYALTLVALWLAYLPLWLKWLLAFSGLIYTAWQWHGIKRSRVVRLTWGRGDEWMLGLRSGEQIPAQLIHHRLFVGYIILHFKSLSKTHDRVIVCADNATPRVCRHLRIRLRSTSN